MRPLLTFLFSTFFCLLPLASHGGSSPPKSTFRVHIQTVEQGGALGTQIIPVNLTNPPKQIMIRAQPEVSERDIILVEAAESDAGVALRISLDDHATTVMNAATLQNQGKILVIFLNGRVVYAPIIDRVISDGVLVIPRGVAPDEVPLLKEAAKQARK